MCLFCFLKSVRQAVIVFQTSLAIYTDKFMFSLTVALEFFPSQLKLLLHLNQSPLKHLIYATSRIDDMLSVKYPPLSTACGLLTGRNKLFLSVDGSRFDFISLSSSGHQLSAYISFS